MKAINMQAIGHVKSEITELKDDYWGNVEAQIFLNENFNSDSLLGLDEFSHIDVYFYMDQVDADKIIKDARHPRNNKMLPKLGIFAQRAKNRPNQIGHTTVKLISVDQQHKTITVLGLDAVNNTPVLDIKPYIKQFAPREQVFQPAWVDEIMKNYFDEKAG